MWVRSQDGRILGNFNVFWIDGKVVMGSVASNDGDSWTLGRYNTSEQAEKVLDIIIDMQNCNLAHEERVFSMPKEVQNEDKQE